MFLILKWGKNGQFLACSGYPDCQNTMDFKRNEDGKIIPSLCGDYAGKGIVEFWLRVK